MRKYKTFGDVPIGGRFQHAGWFWTRDSEFSARKDGDKFSYCFRDLELSLEY